jgi:hypothetical protein
MTRGRFWSLLVVGKELMIRDTVIRLAVTVVVFFSAACTRTELGRVVEDQ